MLKKTVIAQGFRLAFSDELGGMPYTEDEVQQQEPATPDYEIVPTEEEKKAARKKRAGLNKMLKECHTEAAFNEAMAKFNKKYPDELSDPTLHDDTETFGTLSAEHHERILQEEASNKDNIQDKFDELCNKAIDADSFQELEDFFFDNKMQTNEENTNRVNSIGKTLNIGDY